MEKSSSNLSVIKLGEILIKIQSGTTLESVYSNLSAEEMRELRNFLEEELRYLSNTKDGNPITLADIKSNYEPVPNYYYKQDCREPLESCLNETCLTSNPGCFSRKMKSQIEILTELMRPFVIKE